jgi:hypothetical protein
MRFSFCGRRKADVQERIKPSGLLLELEIGFETVEAMSAKADIALRHLEDFLTGAA